MSKPIPRNCYGKDFSTGYVELGASCAVIAADRNHTVR